MRFAITRKLAANLLAVVLFLTVAGIFISRQIADVHQQTRALREKARILEAAANLRLALTNMAMPANDYLITGNPEERLNFARASEKALRIAGLLRQMPLSKEQRAVLEQIVAGHQEIKQRGEGILAISDPVGNTAAGRAMEELDAAADALARRTQELYALLHREMEAALLKADRSGARAINLFLGASFLLFLSFLLIFGLINASIVNPMRRFIAAAQIVAGGDLSHNIAIRSGDGFAELGEAFNHMTANLRRLVAQVRQVAEHSARSAEEIGQLIQEIQRETQQAVSAMAQTGEEAQKGTKVMGATGQAFATIVAAVERLSERMDGVARAAADVTRQASDASQAVQSIAAITQENAAAAQEVAASTQSQEAALKDVAASAQALAELARQLQQEVRQFTV